MIDLLLWWVGVIVVIGLLTTMTVLVGALAYVKAEDAAKDLLRYRRLSWLRYWAQRLEKEGLLPIDQHYREISRCQRPIDVDQAYEWEDATPKETPHAK